MNTFIFLDVLGNFLGDGVVMSENITKYFFHVCRFWNELFSIWEPENPFKNLGQLFITLFLILPLKNALIISLLSIVVVLTHIFVELPTSQFLFDER